MKKILSLALVLVFALSCFVACGGVAGTYKFSYMEMAGVKYEAGSEIPVLGAFTEDSYVIELKDDGTAVISVNMMGMTQSMEGTWEEADGKVSIEIAGEAQEVAIDGNTMTIGVDGLGEAKMVLEK